MEVAENDKGPKKSSVNDKECIFLLGFHLLMEYTNAEEFVNNQYARKG